MPEHRPRTRLVGALAASLVALFVVVVGAAPSNATGARAGVAAAGTSTAQAGPVELGKSLDVAAVGLDLAGILSTTSLPLPALVADRTDLLDTRPVADARTLPSDRGPPAR
jgi:hypothetical protein